MMMKNGLALISLGCLLFMFSVNPKTLKYDFLLMATAVSLIVLGAVLAYKGNKNAKKAEVKQHENR
ncbi:DUF3188 domain-containing protein [Vagococcus zengguangii]|uniref:DUF3188 domain-containing protein n=1 Tax=Vagococcus zengguangii TaxID=2571750 RepID=A0A4D7CXE7_9ENTE|nr:DUF3188 domain-containing protein [Vagococcus zengguangii]QCI87067.1 DUF3188 domain-containing protein [Vagococcus zengguangii]TLG80894.1 DUF3188 domain-containing protein [Vagococcus zengguangii]